MKFVLYGVWLLAMAVVAIPFLPYEWGLTPPPRSQDRRSTATATELAARYAQEQQRNLERDRRSLEDKQRAEKDKAELTYLCQREAACRKYEKGRLECATAANLKSCIEIKMGSDTFWINTCTNNEGVGAPLGPLPRNTPNQVLCFLSKIFD
jgi:hypothetical protein